MKQSYIMAILLFLSAQDESSTKIKEGTVLVRIFLHTVELITR